jgi:hypothetical protein
VTRRYDEPIEVHLRDAIPDQFLWRDRLYVIREVLEHWVESGGWWREPQTGLDDGDREIWRVEAAYRGAGDDHTTGIYELAFDTATGRWMLAVVID